MQLLRANSNKRLGINGAKEVKEHPWFTGIDWGMVQRRELEMQNLP